jgi:hypothetical protein
MAKKHAQRLVDAAAREDPHQLRELRRLEAEVRRAQAALSLEQRKREQAEAELVDSIERESLLLASQGEFAEATIKAVRRKSSAKHPTVPIICATDWHAEATVERAVVNNLNEYNLAIFRQRVAKLWEKSCYLIDLWRTVSDVRDAVLWLGGDLISGSIHPELEESNQLGPMQAIVEIQQQVAAGIEYLLANSGVERLLVVTSNGNHGRITQKPRIATNYRHSLEWLAYNNLAARFATDRRVTVNVGVGYHTYVDIFRHVVRFHHGDSIRYHGGVGGITIPTTKAIAQWNRSRKADLDVFGHYHQFLDTWNWVACSSLIGVDAYAISIKCDFQPPSQTIIFINEQHGKVGALPIFVE